MCGNRQIQVAERRTQEPFARHRYTWSIGPISRRWSGNQCHNNHSCAVSATAMLIALARWHGARNDERAQTEGLHAPRVRRKRAQWRHAAPRRPAHTRRRGGVRRRRGARRDGANARRRTSGQRHLSAWARRQGRYATFSGDPRAYALRQDCREPVRAHACGRETEVARRCRCILRAQRLRGDLSGLPRPLQVRRRVRQIPRRWP